MRGSVPLACASERGVLGHCHWGFAWDRGSASLFVVLLGPLRGTIPILEIFRVVEVVVVASLVSTRTHAALVFVKNLLLRWATLLDFLLPWLLNGDLPVLGTHPLVVVMSPSHRRLLLLELGCGVVAS